MDRIFHIGSQAMSASAQALYNVESPQYGPDWPIRRIRPVADAVVRG